MSETISVHPVRRRAESLIGKRAELTISARYAGTPGPQFLRGTVRVVDDEGVTLGYGLAVLPWAAIVAVRYVGLDLP